MQELTTTLNAIYKREERHNKFNAAMQGVDLDSASETDNDQAPATLNDVYARVQARLSGQDVPSEAVEMAQFGLAYEKAGGE